MSRRTVLNNPHEPAHSPLVSTPARGGAVSTLRPIPKIGYSSSYATHPVANTADHAHTYSLPTPPASSASSPVAILEAHAHGEDPWREKLLFEGTLSRTITTARAGGIGGIGGVGRRGKASGVESDLTGVPEGVGMGTGSGAASQFGGGSGGSGLGWAVPSTYAPASTGADPLLGSNTPEGDIRRLTPKDKGKERSREDGIMAVKVLADVMDTSKGRDKVLVSARRGLALILTPHTLASLTLTSLTLTSLTLTSLTLYLAPASGALWTVNCGLGNRGAVVGRQWVSRIARRDVYCETISNDWPSIIPDRHALDRVASELKAQLAQRALRASQRPITSHLSPLTSNFLLLCSARSASRACRHEVSPRSVPALTLFVSIAEMRPVLDPDIPLPHLTPRRRPTAIALVLGECEEDADRAERSEPD
ncbi:hypothetical protein EHS25_006400 [Saitozyma podzolica]|uniref:Uncharacterized protein n=1 Tax=Saitozyma podzolica TaxID=1890683 RepID=A0A427YRQ5_9TREE|nr:hypothetical protein EHS25_006400 [Saitozyma podzolica]